MLINMAGNDHPLPVLLPAEPADISALATLQMAACRFDLDTRLIVPSDTTFEGVAISMVQSQIASPEYLIMKAVHPENGDIMGWGSWRFVHYPEIDAKIKQQAEAASTTNDPTGSRSMPEQVESDTSSSLGSSSEKHLREVMDSWMGERKFLLLTILVTEPRYQRRGVGSALVRWGNAKADADNVPGFLEGSPFAFKLYLECGWKLVEKHDVDLSEWTPYGKRYDMGYGIYSHYYMIRLPEPGRRKCADEVLGV